MPLYIGRIEHEFMFVAEDDDEAYHKARFLLDEIIDGDPVDEFDTMPARGRMAVGYDRDCLPWGGDGERTIGEYMAEEADAIPEPVEDTP